MGRLKRAAVTYMIAAVLAFMGLVFLLIAAWIYLARRVGPMEASFWFAGAFLVMAVLIVIVHRLAEAARERSARRQRTRDLAAVGASTAVAAVPLLSRGKSGLGAIAVGVAILGGYAAYSLWSGREPRNVSAFSRSRRRRR